MITTTELSPLVGCPTAPLTAYFYNVFRTATSQVQKMMNYLWLKEQLTLNIRALLMVAKEVLRYSRDGDPRVTQSGNYDILTPLYGIMGYCTGRRLAILLGNGKYDMEIAFFCCQSCVRS